MNQPTRSAKNLTRPAPADFFEIQIRVDPDDIDELGHVNNVVYLRWVQEAAVAHWKSAAPSAEQRKLAWLVVRHEIDYKRPAVLHDELLARTWVGTASGVAFERLTEIVSESDGEVLARARTLWCPVDAETGRPVRVSRGIRERFSIR